MENGHSMKIITPTFTKFQTIVPVMPQHHNSVLIVSLPEA